MFLDINWRIHEILHLAVTGHGRKMIFQHLLLVRSRELEVHELIEVPTI